MVLTFEKIRELYWNEKDMKELQELPENFFAELREYLERKGDDEQIKHVVDDLINRRIKKIIDAALVYLKTKIYPINLTEEEKMLFEEVLRSLKRFNEVIFKTSVVSGIGKEGLEKRTEEEIEKENKKEEKGEKPKEKEDLVIVKEDLPEFVGPDLKIYNLKKNDKVRLPKELKEFLTKKNVIVEANNR